MKRLLAFLIVPFLLGCPGSTPAEQAARNTIALATGAIQAAQADYKAECSALPTAPKCVLINEAVKAQNLSITALEVYCGFTVNVSLPTDTCVPVKTAQAALTSAVANLGALTGEITALLKSGKNKAALGNARDWEASILASTPAVPKLYEIERLRLSVSCDFNPCQNWGYTWKGGGL